MIQTILKISPWIAYEEVEMENKKVLDIIEFILDEKNNI